MENVELLTLSYHVYQITSDIICSPTMVTVAAAHRCETQGAHISHLSASDGLNFTTYTLPLGGRGGVINGDFQVL